jgi:hypothetical protein
MFTIENEPIIQIAWIIYMTAISIMDEELGKMDKWQHQDVFMIFTYRKICLNRTRGGSKTRDMSLVAIFFLIRRNKPFWLTPRSKQLLRAMEYWNENPFVKKFNQFNFKQTHITLINGRVLEIAVATEGNIEGPRKNIIMIDEMARMDKNTADLIMPIFNGMSGVGDGIYLICFSTPKINTVFEEYAMMYPVIERDWTYPSWFDHKNILEIKLTISPSRWKSEYCCIFSSAEGQVFDECITSMPYRGQLRRLMYWGSDPNPREGYCLVGLQYSIDLKHAVVQFVKNFGPNKRGLQSLSDFLIPLSKKEHLHKVELEDNGVGLVAWDEYISQGGKGDRVFWGTRGKGDKVRRANIMNTLTIHIDPSRKDIPAAERKFWRQLVSQILGVVWSKSGDKIDKPQDQPWHLSDSLMHACSYGDGLFAVTAAW